MLLKVHGSQLTDLLCTVDPISHHDAAIQSTPGHIYSGMSKFTPNDGALHCSLWGNFTCGQSSWVDEHLTSLSGNVPASAMYLQAMWQAPCVGESGTGLLE